MKLDFSEVNFHQIGRRAATPDAMWGKLTLGMNDADTDHVHSVEIVLLLSKRRDATMKELETEARDRSIAILREALSLLEANDIATLESKSQTP